MAAGIISVGTLQLGPDWLSRVLLVIACAGLVVLGAALIARLAFFRASVAADVAAPDRVFGFFTIPAGLNVLGVRFALAGHPVVTAVLAGVADAGAGLAVAVRVAGPVHAVGRRRRLGAGRRRVPHAAAPTPTPSGRARARHASGHDAALDLSHPSCPTLTSGLAAIHLHITYVGISRTNRTPKRS
jgi:hypothetical protein